MQYRKKVFICLLIGFLLCGCQSNTKTSKKTTTKVEDTTTSEKEKKKENKTKKEETKSNPSLNTDEVSIKLGKTYLLVVTGNNDQNIKWGSYNNNVAVVGPEGLVISKAPGTTYITANVDGKTLTCKVIITSNKSANKNKTNTNKNSTKKQTEKQTSNATVTQDNTSQNQNEKKNQDGSSEDNKSNITNQQTDNDNSSSANKTYLAIYYHVSSTGETILVKTIDSNSLKNLITNEANKWVDENQDALAAKYGPGTFEIQEKKGIETA